MASTLFRLRFGSDADSISFLDDGYAVMDGGFQISTPTIDRKFVEFSPGFFRPSLKKVGMRDARIMLQITAATRSAALEKVHAIERMLLNVEKRASVSGGTRCELGYQWVGQEKWTFFEVYGGEVVFPDDMLSVEKMFVTDSSGNVVLNEIELNLILSGYGYASSFVGLGLPNGGGIVQLPLTNVESIVGSLDYVNVYSPGHDSLLGDPFPSTDSIEHLNYIKIAGSAIDGTAPGPIYIELSRNVSDSFPLKSIHVGLSPTLPRKAGFPASQFFDTAGVYEQGCYGTEIVSGDAYDGSFMNTPIPHEYAFYESLLWTDDTIVWNEPGIYNFYLHQFVNATYPPNHNWRYMLSITDSITSAPKLRGSPISVSKSNMAMLLGTFSKQYLEGSIDYDTLNRNSILLKWAGQGSGVINTDFVSVLPITWGFRIYEFPKWPTNDLYWSLYDAPYFRYVSSSDGIADSLYSSFNSYLSPLKIEPGVDNYLFFNTNEDSSLVTSPVARNRFLKVKIYHYPAYTTLAY